MSNEAWHPDVNVTEAIASQLIENKCQPDLVIADIECIGEGWDNKVYLVNRQYVFRFPQRKIANDLIARENSLLKNIHQYLSINIPMPIFFGQASIEYPYNFHGYQIINGISGCHANLSDAARERSIIPVAHFLKELHQIPLADAIKLGAKPQVFDRTQTDTIIKNLSETVAKINSKQHVQIRHEEFENEIALVNKIKLEGSHVLVHGDLYCRHLLFNQEILTGIIDWGDVGTNNRAVDLAAIFHFYPKKVHKTFLDIYGEVSANTWTYARFLGLHRAITILHYGNEVGDAKLVAEAVNSFQRINSRILCS